MHDKFVYKTQQKTVDNGTEQIVEHQENFDTQPGATAALGTLMQQILLGAAYAILEEFHIVDV